MMKKESRHKLFLFCTVSTAVADWGSYGFTSRMNKIANETAGKDAVNGNCSNINECI